MPKNLLFALHFALFVPPLIAQNNQWETYSARPDFGDKKLSETASQNKASEVLQVTCTSTCQGSLGDNIFPDGDFGAGIPNIVPVNPNLAPGYIYTLNPPPDDGFYCITNNTTFWGSFANSWIDIEDNGPEPNGYMMVVNASYQPGLFYQKTVGVCENTPYEFSIDVINLFLKTLPGSIRPNISFLINGNEVCETGDIPDDEKWHTSRFSFVSGPGQSTLTFALRNNAPGGYGNDLAIDNISLRPCGPTLAIPDLYTYCTGMTVSIPLEIVNSPFQDPVFQWQIFNNGQWEDLPNTNNDTLAISNPIDGSLIRVVVANSINNLSLSNCRIISETALLKQLPDPIVSLATQDISCFGAVDGTIKPNITQGTAPFSYVWASGETTDLLSNMNPGIYYLTVTDGIGCVGTASATLVTPSALLADASGTPVNCFGGSNATASITASGGTSPYSYLWSNSETTGMLSNLPAGTYQVTVTDAHGCTELKAVAIVAPEPLTALSNSTNVDCFGAASATASISVTGGTTPYTYAWSNLETTAALSGLTKGDYLITITDRNGCTAIDSLFITEPPILSTHSNATNISCFNGSDGTVTITVQGGTAPYAYSWSTGDTLANLSGLSAGIYETTVTDANGCSIIETIALSSASALASSIAATAVSCFGGTDGMLSVLASGGTAPLDFHWNNGTTSASLNNLNAGNYQLTITDANGCTEVASAIISEPPLLMANSTQTDVSCFGGSNAQLITAITGGVGPYAYNWSNAESTGAIANLPAGSYELTITDANGCTTQLASTISEPPVLLAQASSNNVSCNGGMNGNASTVISGGVLPYTFQWSNGQTNSALNNIPAGNYQLTISDLNGCTTTSSAIIAQPAELSLTLNTFETTCSGSSDGTASTTISGGTPPYQYLWSNGQTNMLNENLAAGTYGITVTDDHACILTGLVSVNQPSALEISTQTEAVSCFGLADGAILTSLLGGTAPYNYLWNTGIGIANPSNLSAGNYLLTATDANGCTITTQTSITEPNALGISASVHNANCHGENSGSISATIEGGTLPYQLHWNNGMQTPQISNLNAGNYTLSVTDANGCILHKSVPIAEPPPILVQTDLIPISCPGMSDGVLSSMAQGGVPPYNFHWSSGQTNATIQSLGPGDYTLLITDTHGCTVFLDKTLTEPILHTVDLGDDLLIQLGDYLELTALTSLAASEILDFTWSGSQDSLQCAHCGEYRFQPIGPGCERVLVRSKKGCKAYDSVCFKLNTRKRIYVPNVFSPDGDGVNDFFTIFSDASVKEITSLSIYNRWGGQLYQAEHIKTNDEPAGWNGTFKGQDMNIDVFVWVAELEFIDGEHLKLSGDVTLVR